MFPELDNLPLIKLKSILKFKYFYILSALITIIAAWLLTQFPLQQSVYNGKESFIKGTIESIEIDGDLFKITLNAKEQLKVYYRIQSEQEKKEIANQYKIGDLISIKGSLEKPSNNTFPNLFNYRKYLYNKDIHFFLKATSIEYIRKSNNLRLQLKSKLNNYLQTFDTTGAIKAFLFGDVSDLEQDVLESNQMNGTSHLLAVSGLHITIIVLSIYYVFNKLRMFNEVTFMITTIIILFYMFLIGLQPSIVRSVMMFILLGLKKIRRWKINQINLLCIVLILQILLNPYTIYELGFIYSYLCTTIIFLSQEIIKRYKFSLLTISILTFFVGLPVTLFNNFEVSILSIPVNLLLIPFITYIVFPLCILSFLLPMIYPLLKVFYMLFTDLSLYFSSLSFFRIIFLKPSVLWIVIYYIVFIYCLYQIEQGKYQKQSILMISTVLAYLYLSPYIKREGNVYFLDVGQGDSILIQLPYNQGNYLIDTGGAIQFKTEEWKQSNQTYSLIKSKTIPFLKSLGIRKLDGLFLTHGDYDHMGNAVDLITNFKVNHVYFNSGNYNDNEEKLIHLLKKYKIKYNKIISGNIYKNEEYTIDVLKHSSTIEDENELSTVLYSKLGKYSFLFTGDLSINGEKQILRNYPNLKVDCLKLGHHGSKTSTSNEFLSQLQVKIGIISSGKNNRYGHPHKEVIDRLKEYHVNYFNTQSNGTIQYTFTGKNSNFYDFHP